MICCICFCGSPHPPHQIKGSRIQLLISEVVSIQAYMNSYSFWHHIYVGFEWKSLIRRISVSVTAQCSITRIEWRMVVSYLARRNIKSKKSRLRVSRIYCFIPATRLLHYILEITCSFRSTHLYSRICHTRGKAMNTLRYLWLNKFSWERDMITFFMSFFIEVYQSVYGSTISAFIL